MSVTGEKSFTFSCDCGARLRARLVIVGRKARCKTCGRMITIPKPRESHRHGTLEGNGSKGGAIAVDELCSICQNPIESDEPKTICGKCGLPFHEECWRENLGCSAYGCPNVSALKTGPDIRITVPLPLPLANRAAVVPVYPPLAAPPPTVEEGIPWEFVLLAASVFATILGMFMYGLPAIVVAVINKQYLARATRRPNMAVVIVCFILCGIGFLVGIIAPRGIYSQ
jgi:hypothetical protein